MVEGTYMVTGMTCEHCVKAVTSELSELPGVTKVDVDLASGRVLVVADRPPSEDAVRAAVAAAGYELAEPPVP